MLTNMLVFVTLLAQSISKISIVKVFAMDTNDFENVDKNLSLNENKSQ